MADEFIALIQPKLDTNQLESQISNLKPSTKIKIGIDTKYIKKQVESALKGVEASSKNISSQINKALSAVNTKTYDAKISSLKKQLSQYSASKGTNEYNQVLQSIQNAAKAYKELQASIAQFDADASDNNAAKLIASYEKLNSVLKTARSEMQIFSDKQSEPANYTAIIAAQKNLTTLCQNNAKIIKEYKTEVDALNQSLQEMLQKGATSSQLNNVISHINLLETKAISKENTESSLKDNTEKVPKQINYFTEIYNILQGKIQDLPQKMVTAVYEVDTAMTNLYKVTDETTAKYNTFLDDAGEKAKSLGRDMSSFIEQTSEWAKLGYTLDEAAELSKVSSIYASVGEVGDATAVSDLVAAMKAYDTKAADAIKIADSYNKLGNEFATSAADLGEGISNAASSLSTSGNTFDQSVAMLTGMAEITQSASEGGNALKTLSMRLRGYDEETESYSNDVEKLTEKIADLTKTASTPDGIRLFTDSTKETYKSTYQIMKEISEIWDQLTDKSRTELTEVLAGKNHEGQISALIQAFQSGQVEEALNVSLTSGGSAQEEHDRWMESMEAKIQQFNTAFQELSNTTISSDFLKGIVDTGTTAINIINLLTKSFGSLNTIIGVIGGFFTTKKGFGKRNAALYKMKQNNRRFINVENFIASNINKPNSINY